ncbi:MAG: hypothetical protein ACRECV_12555 [Xanthobacteraceae bacterium]
MAASDNAKLYMSAMRKAGALRNEIYTLLLRDAASLSRAERRTISATGACCIELSGSLSVITGVRR